MYSTFVESLKRLYASQKVNLSKLDELKTLNKITADEHEYITAQ